MLSPEFQGDVPGSMFVFPVRAGVALPPEFERHAVVPAHPLELPPAEIGRNRDRWIREWTDIVLR
jgi:thiamine transport system substrate-binding protein